MITFNTIYNFLVDHKILLKVSHIENVMESQEQQSSEEGSCHDDRSWYESVEYTCTLEKTYNFLKMVMFKLSSTIHGLVNLMWFVWHVPFYHLYRKTKSIVYCVTFTSKESTCCVVTTYCTCPAGLSGCCNYITLTLNCREDFVHRGLREEEWVPQKSCRNGTSLRNVRQMM